jgi:hypothetical protein
MKVVKNLILITTIIIFSQSLSHAAIKYIRQGANGSGTSWSDAFGSLPGSLVRGNTYYIADGNYPSYTFDDSESGSTLIYIKKATIADHGTDTGWKSTYGDGQAVLGSTMTFTTGYYVIDGNGTHTIPSDNTKDYGFKVSHNSSTNITGIIRFGASGNTVSNITLRYTHVYNTTNGSINNGTVSLRYYPSASQQYIKVQNCFLQNSGKDGIQISKSSYLLFERCYIERLGRLYSGDPDYHGQTVQIFYGGDDIIFRWNIWEANEGQGLIQIAGIKSVTQNVRFYGNVVFVKYGHTSDTPGFNSSGGIIGDAWNYEGQDGVYIYNNTFVNIGGDYGNHAHFPMGNGTNEYGYNNLFYNCDGSTGASGFSGWGNHASGGGKTYGGVNEQAGISSGIFTNYTGNDFTLTYGTAAGKNLSQEAWWDSSDSFFSYLDSNLDMSGYIRGKDGVWDRGAYEYDSEGSVSEVPSAPENLKVIQ